MKNLIRYLVVIALVIRISFPVDVFAATAPTIMDTLPIAKNSSASSNSISSSCPIPAGGVNKVVVLLIAASADILTGNTTKIHGATVTLQHISTGAEGLGAIYYATLVATSSGVGTCTSSWTTAHGVEWETVTVQDANTVNIVDKTCSVETAGAASVTCTATTNLGNDLLIGEVLGENPTVISTTGAETAINSDLDNTGTGHYMAISKAAAATAGSEFITGNYTPSTSGTSQQSWLAISAIATPKCMWCFDYF